MTDKTKPQPSSFSGTGEGIAVDAQGGPVVDPTQNVRELVLAAIQRQDDLRFAYERLTEARLQALKDLANLRAEHVIEIGKLETRRIDNLRDVQLQHVEQMAVARESHAARLMQAEASRINAIREVDVSGVATATERATQQAVVLANQVSASAETLRALVASTNAQAAATLNQITTQFGDRLSAVEKSASDRISLLEKSSYEGKGKEAVSDPALAIMVAELRSLRTDMTLNAGKGEGYQKVWGWLVAAAGSGGVLAFLVAHFTK